MTKFLWWDQIPWMIHWNYSTTRFWIHWCIFYLKPFLNEIINLINWKSCTSSLYLPTLKTFLCTSIIYLIVLLRIWNFSTHTSRTPLYLFERVLGFFMKLIGYLVIRDTLEISVLSGHPKVSKYALVGSGSGSVEL